MRRIGVQAEPSQDERDVQALFDACGNGDYSDVKKRLAQVYVDINQPHGLVSICFILVPGERWESTPL